RLGGPRPPPAGRTGGGVDPAIVAVSFGATEVMIAAPAKPRAPPAAPPTMPMTTASPSTWAVIRLERHPSALSVPNSRTRRATAAIVSRLATANAAISTRIDSHLPSSLASLAVLDTDPVTWLARLAAVGTVAPGRRFLLSA